MIKMVLRSYTRKKMSIKIDPSKIEEFIVKIQKRFKDQISVHFEGNRAIIEGEGLNDYRIHESLLYILTEGKHGKDL